METSSGRYRGREELSTDLLRLTQKERLKNEEAKAAMVSPRNLAFVHCPRFCSVLPSSFWIARP